MATLFKQTDITKNHGIVYPDRVILSILTHGNITVNKDNSEKTFIMPAGIKMKRGYSSVPGVCNYISNNVNAYFVNTIQQSKQELETIPFENIDNKFRKLLNIFKKYDEQDTVKPLTRFVKYKSQILAQDDEQAIEDVIDSERYIDTYDKFYQISTYLPGDKVIDKLYTRTNKEAVNNPSQKAWVTVLNNVDNIDLFTILRPQTRHGTIEIYLSEIVDYLKNQGVKEIIIFDNSCSVFVKEDLKPTDRDIIPQDNGIKFRDYTDISGREFTDRDIRKRRRTIENSETVKFGGNTKSKSKKHKSYKKYKKTKKHNKKQKETKLIYSIITS